MRTVVALLVLAVPILATTYHVQKTGDDNSASGPFLTINKAAQMAQPGDSIIVHAGVYREWVQPPRGGSSESTRIVYKAAPGEEVEIKGSERVTTWVSQGNGVWRVDLADAFFNGYNPFSMDIFGRYPGNGAQWLNAGSWCHLGEVYLDGQIYYEKQTLAEVQGNQRTWYTSRSGTTSSIYANFGTNDPNAQLAEVNAREGVFGHSTITSGINFITVDGFHLSQSADCWAPPYNGNPLISFAVLFPTGTNWLIKNCTIKHGKMRGICLDGPRGNKNHIVRDNTITDCGIGGICGNYADGSTISGNWISDIHGTRPYWGDEHGCIKFNQTVNVTVCGNVLRKMISPNQGRTIMIDYNGDGWRITGNVFVEASETHIYWLQQNFASSSAALVDNNVFIGNTPNSGTQVYYVHNLYYCNGGGSSSGSNVILGNGSLAHIDDTAAKSISLTFTLSSAVAAQNNTIMTTGSLGTNPGQVFPGVSLNRDIMNMCRTPTAKSGPFQNIVSGANTILFRPNSNFLDNAPCAMPDTNVVGTPDISPAGGYLFSPTRITMSCATSGAQIYYTLDNSDPSQTSTLYAGPFMLSNPSTIKARGYKTGKTPSEVGSAVFAAPRAPENPAHTVAGLSYSYYEGAWTSLPDFNTLTPVKTGTIGTCDLAIRNRDDNFGVVYSGYIEVPQSGVYTFTTSSDDGSALYIGTAKIVDNDGSHGTQSASGAIGLTAGKHAISVEYFEAGGEQVLTVSWGGPGVTTGQIPAGALYRATGATVLRPATTRGIIRKNGLAVELFGIDGKRSASTAEPAIRNRGRAGVCIVRAKDGSGAITVRRVAVVR